MRVDGINVEDNAGPSRDDGLAAVEREGLRDFAGGFGDTYEGVPEAKGFELEREG